MKTSILKITFLLSLLLLICSCSDDEKDESSNSCYEQFEIISIDVKYTDGAPVTLDQYRVTWEDKEITPIKDFNSEEYKKAQTSGLYPIINDSMKLALKGKTATISVTGYLNGGIVISEDYRIGADECHIFYADDKSLKITIDPETVPIDIYSYIPMQVRYSYSAETREPLDRYKIMWGDRDITPNIPTDSEEFKMFQEANSYPMINNDMRAEIEGKDAILTFIGYIGGKEVCSRNFTVSADEKNVFYKDPKPPYVPIAFTEIDSTICTTYMAMVDVHMQYTDGAPVTNLKMEVMWDDRNIAIEELNPIMYDNSRSGKYAIISDWLKREVYGKIVTLEFIGYIDDKEVYRDKYKVSSDGCHVFSPDYKSLTVTIKKP